MKAYLSFACRWRCSTCGIYSWDGSFPSCWNAEYHRPSCWRKHCSACNTPDCAPHASQAVMSYFKGRRLYPVFNRFLTETNLPVSCSLIFLAFERVPTLALLRIKKLLALLGTLTPVSLQVLSSLIVHFPTSVSALYLIPPGRGSWTLSPILQLWLPFSFGQHAARIQHCISWKGTPLNPCPNEHGFLLFCVVFCLVEWFSRFMNMGCTSTSSFPRLSPSSRWAQQWSKKNSIANRAFAKQVKHRS